MPLPLTVSCFSKIQVGFYLSRTGQRALKRVCVCVCYFQTTTTRPASTTPSMKVPGALVKVPSDNIYIFIIQIAQKRPEDANISGK